MNEREILLAQLQKTNAVKIKDRLYFIYNHYPTQYDIKIVLRIEIDDNHTKARIDIRAVHPTFPGPIDTFLPMEVPMIFNWVDKRTEIQRINCLLELRKDELREKMGKVVELQSQLKQLGEIVL